MKTGWTREDLSRTSPPQTHNAQPRGLEGRTGTQPCRTTRHSTQYSSQVAAPMPPPNHPSSPLPTPMPCVMRPPFPCLLRAALHHDAGLGHRREAARAAHGLVPAEQQ
eukprot:scaffold96441_cov57-Phaeocystis_antarctica.AAC.1